MSEVVKVRVGQQNAVNIVSSLSGISVGIPAFAYVAGISSVSGISSYSQLSGLSTYSSFSGISSYSQLSGLSTYSSFSGISSYANISGLSTSTSNILGGRQNSIVYQASPGISSFISTGTFGQVLYTNVRGVPTWIDEPPRAAVSGITVLEEDDIVGRANAITILRFLGDIVTATPGIRSDAVDITVALVEVDGGEY